MIHTAKKKFNKDSLPIILLIYKHDSTRAASPMKKAPDAELLDTTHMTVEEAVKHICDQVLKNGENLPPKS